MDAQAFVESLKNFFLDIIGFLIPGVFLLILLSIAILPDFYMATPMLNVKPSLYDFFFMVISYILGYLVYGLGIIKDDLLKSRSSSKKIEERIKKRTDFALAKAKYSQFITSNNIGAALPNNMTTRELRSLVMSFNSENDNNKVYTFMFRSDLCKHMAHASLFVALFCLIDIAISAKWHSLLLVHNDSKSVMFYLVLVVAFFLFRKTRNYFYDIAIKLPFSLYLAK